MYRILIADDEVIERTALKHIISGGCSRITGIEEASNGREAIQKAGSFKPDIILMDIKMPGINGIEAAKTIKQFAPDCRIVLLTAFDYFEYAHEAIHIGVVDFIIKPATNEQVIEIVNKIVDTLQNERHRMDSQMEIQNKFSQISLYIERELVSSIFNGDMHEVHISEYFSVMDIDFYKGFAAVVKIDFNRSYNLISSQYQKDMIKKRYMDKLKIEMEKLGLLCLAAHNGNDIHILAILTRSNADVYEQKDLQGLLKEIYIGLQQQLDIGITIGIGEITSNHGKLYDSFMQARTACNSQEDLGGIVYPGIKERKQKASAYPREIEDKLCESLIICDERQCITLIEEIAGWIRKNIDNIDEIRWKMCELLVLLLRTSDREFSFCEKNLKVCYEEMLQMESITEFKNYIIHEVKNIINRVDDIKIDRSAVLIDKVCEFIRRNYTKEISLDEAAGVAGLSNFYFSKVFKFYKKVNFIDYIKEVRINKAKGLLKDPTINIKDIGGLVGYYDPNYFTRVFKKVEGVTPTEYRGKKMLLSQKNDSIKRI